MAEITQINVNGTTYDIKDSSAVKTVNNNLPDANGNVTIQTGGSGVPSGGTVGQILIKQSSDDGDVNWENIPSDSTKVSKSGDTMTGALGMQNVNVNVTDTNVTSNVTSSSNTYGDGFYLLDSNGYVLGYARTISLTNGNQGMQLEAKRTVNGTTTYNTINLLLDTSGNKVVDVSDQAAWRTGIGAAAASHTHGNITNAGDITATATIASGDRIVINDESASKIINSSITFGTATTTFLSNKGTWVTPVVQGINTSNQLVSKDASSSWTATQDCWGLIFVDNNYANYGCGITIDGVDILTYHPPTAGAYTYRVPFFVKKGQVIATKVRTKFIAYGLKV